MPEECPLGSHHCALATSHPMSLATNFQIDTEPNPWKTNQPAAQWYPLSAL